VNVTDASWSSSAQPQARVRRLHRVTDDRQKIARQRIQFHLVGEPRAEGIERAHRVVARAVEALIGSALDALRSGWKNSRRAGWSATRIAAATRKSSDPVTTG
jgi:hypothetical protein